MTWTALTSLRTLGRRHRQRRSRPGRRLRAVGPRPGRPSPRPTPASAGTRTPTTSTRAATATSSASTRPSWCTTTAPTRRCAGCSTSWASPPSETDMSMSVRDDASGLEYAGARGIGGLFPSWSSLTRPRYLLHAGRGQALPPAATRLLADWRRDATGKRSATFVDRHGFSQLLRRPLHDTARSRRCGRARREQALKYPARYLFVFLEHHGMLSVFNSPTWRTVVGGSATLRRGDRRRASTRCTPAPR